MDDPTMTALLTMAMRRRLTSHSASSRLACSSASAVAKISSPAALKDAPAPPVGSHAPLPPPARFRTRISALSAASCCLRWAIAAAAGSRFTTGLLRMARALAAYRSVDSVSSRLMSAGDTQAIMTVRELPPSESCCTHMHVAPQGMHVAFAQSVLWLHAHRLVEPGGLHCRSTVDAQALPCIPV